MDYPAERRERLARCLVEEDLDALVVESPEIVFTVRVVGDAEIVEGCDCLHQPLNCFETEGCDAGRHNRPATR